MRTDLSIPSISTCRVAFYNFDARLAEAWLESRCPAQSAAHGILSVILRYYRLGPGTSLRSRRGGIVAEFQALVASVLRDAFEEQKLAGYETSSVGAAFFRLWMKDQGNAYFFLFRKNLRVTNMQHAELLALVSAHCFETSTAKPAKSLQFASPADFIATVQGLLETFPVSEVGDKAKWFAAKYSHLLSRTVVVDAFYGSSSIHLPPHLDLDLRTICGLSGYIHS